MAAAFASRAVAWANRTPLLLALYALLVTATGTAVAALEGWPWGDGLWWAVTTTTTTGYGDLSPATIPGRVLAGLTMLAGIVAIGITVGRIAAVVIHTRDDWTHEEQEASARREEATLHALEQLAERMGPVTRVTLQNVGSGLLPPSTWAALERHQNRRGWLAETQRHMGWRLASEALPPLGVAVLVRHRDTNPYEPSALRGHVQRVHGNAGESGAYAFLAMDERPDEPDAARTLVLAGDAWAWREYNPYTPERTTTG